MWKSRVPPLFGTSRSPFLVSSDHIYPLDLKHPFCPMVSDHNGQHPGVTSLYNQVQASLKQLRLHSLKESPNGYCDTRTTPLVRVSNQSTAAGTLVFPVTSVPELAEIPSLELDDGTWSTRPRRAKRRHTNCLKLEDASQHHPLKSHIASQGGDGPERPRRISSSLLSEEIGAVDPEPFDKDEEGAAESEGETELTTFRERRRQLITERPVPLPRANPNYLRIFLAEREMVRHGKLIRVRCQPLLAPRRTQSCEKVLGIVYAWPRFSRKRQCLRLSRADFDE